MTNLQQELEKLMANDKQREAYLYDDHCVVQAGPGSGKTATLTLKIIRLLSEKIPPPRGLACLTFNKEAVRELQNRLKNLGLPQRMNVFLGTVHSFCLSCVINPFARLFCPDLHYPLLVAPEDVVNKCLQEAMDHVGVNQQLSQFRTRFDKYRRTFLDRFSSEWLDRDQECANTIEYYETLLRKRGYADFDDLILIGLTMIEEEPFVRQCLSARYPWFVVDEYQDLGYPLHRIILSLVDKAGVKLFAVGDPDQSIYSFTGADPKYLQELAGRDDMKSVRLELNYRCGQKIIEGAEVILSPPVSRNHRSSRGDIDPGDIRFFVPPRGLEDQVNTIIEEILPKLYELKYEPKEIAILYLDRNDAKVITKALDERGIQYAGEKDQRYIRTPITRWVENLAQWCCGVIGKDRIRFSYITGFWIDMLHDGGKTFTNERLLAEIRFLFSVIYKLRNPSMQLTEWLSELNERLSLREQLSLLKKSPEEEKAFNSMVSACLDGKPLYKFTLADFAGCGPNSNKISLNTLHSSKGLQFDVVIIPGLEEGRLPSWGAQSEEALNEARRTFYVGFTRARHLVYLLGSGYYQDNYKRKYENGLSRFVLELQKKIRVYRNFR